MKPVFPYFGSKATLAPWIVSMMPEHRVYIEPFAGSCAVLFAKSPSRHEIVNDLHQGIVTFFMVLREDPHGLADVCALSPYSRDEYEAADYRLPELEDLERARRWWVRINQSFSATGTFATGWSISVGQNSSNPETTVARIARFRDAAVRLMQVNIESMDAIECIAKYQSADAVIYVDPPYVLSTRSAARQRPDGDYAHDMLDDHSHRVLAEVLCASPATVFLSGYPSPLYDTLYDGWYRVEREVLRRSSNGSIEPQESRTEVVWSNRPIREVEQLGMFTEVTA